MEHKDTTKTSQAGLFMNISAGKMPFFCPKLSHIPKVGTTWDKLFLESDTFLQNFAAKF